MAQKGEGKVRLTVDSDANAAYIYLDDSSTFAPRQVWVEPEGVNFFVILDLSPAGNLIGVEIINADEALPATLLRSLS